MSFNTAIVFIVLLSCAYGAFNLQSLVDLYIKSDREASSPRSSKGSDAAKLVPSPGAPIRSDAANSSSDPVKVVPPSAIRNRDAPSTDVVKPISNNDPSVKSVPAKNIVDSKESSSVKNKLPTRSLSKPFSKKGPTSQTGSIQLLNQELRDILQAENLNYEVDVVQDRVDHWRFKFPANRSMPSCVKTLSDGPKWRGMTLWLF